ncbi:MAG: outer membrane protein OmpA-like peptidoglycan-associated protein [Limisphaerales bacterium]|jgi:outer membrane protein OmpA-like peptidoglycan-associated protein/tetratricopeptide (TPR) repeat protein
MRKYISMLAFVLLATVLLGQSRQEKADRLFERLAYNEAITAYESVVKKEAENTTAKLRLGDCYRLTNNFSEAANWYGQASKSNDFPSEYKLHYGMMLQAEGRCDEAVPFFRAYAIEKPEDSRGKELALGCSQSGAFHADKDLFTINHPAELNTEASDFGPAFFGSGIVFSSARREGSLLKRRHAWTGAPFLDLYFSEKTGEEEEPVFSNPSMFSSKLNTKFNEGPMTFDQTNKKVFFTRNNLVDGKTRKSEDGTIKLKILEADLKGTMTFENAAELPFCSDEYSVAHPTLTADGGRLYYASDMPGGFGGSDIWYVDRSGDGWSSPVNLGDDVNTEGEESFPFIHNDGTLYFASNGHAGIGGLDIFSATTSTDLFAGVRNLGYPLNTKSDDFGFIWDENRELGYFSSNREGSVGSDDLYTMRKIVVILEGFVYDLETGEELGTALIRVSDGTYTKEFNADGNGEFTSEVSPNKVFNVTAEFEGYGPGEVSISTGATSGKSRVEIPMTKLAVFAGNVLDAEGNPTVARVNLVDGEGNIIETVEATADGSFEFEAVPNGDYTIEMVTEGFNATSLNASTEGVRFEKETEIWMPGTPIADCTLPTVYYDLDKSFIRSDAKPALQGVLERLKADPILRVELSSHTDSRASFDYNDALSARRTNSAAEWLISKGVSEDRILRNQHGEYKPVNKCKDGVSCDKTQHQLNRRTEIRCVR